MPRDKGDPPIKLYYRIGEAAGLVGVEPHVLRYWETEFPTIRPQKARSGQRVYSRKDVEKLLRVKELLYSQRFTIVGARQRLREAVTESEIVARPTEPREPADPHDDSMRADLGAMRATLIAMRVEVVALLNELGQGNEEPAPK